MEANIKDIKTQPLRPQMSVNKLVHDFEDVNKGSINSYDFVFTNISDRDIIITQARASCGCTAPSYDKDKVIKPNETSTITANYTAGHTSGTVAKFITVTYNWHIIESNNALTKEQKNHTTQMTKLEIKANII